MSEANGGRLRRLRALVLTTTLPAEAGDGTPGFVLTLARELATRHDVVVMAPRVGGRASATVIDGVRIVRFRYFPRRWERLADGAILPTLRTEPWRALEALCLVVAFALAAVRHSRRFAPDVVHAHWIVPAGLVARVVRRLGGPRYVLTVHGADVYALQGRLARALKRWVLGGSAATLAVSKDVAERIRALGARVEAVVPMGADVASIQLTVGARQPELGRLLFVGRLVPKKGVDVLLDALPAVPSARLTVLGDGPEAEPLACRARALDLTDRVEFRGRQPAEEVLGELRRAMAVVIPSRVELNGDQDGTPVVLAEAMAAGVPVVASALGGLDEQVRDGVTGLLVPPGDAPALAHALSTTMRDPRAADARAAAAQQVVEQTFDVRQVACRYERAFTDASSGTSGNGAGAVSSNGHGPDARVGRTTRRRRAHARRPWWSSRWTAAVVGAALALPLLRHVDDVVRGADSSRLVASIIHVHHHGIGFLRSTQDVLLPHLVLGPLFALGGARAANFVTVASIVVLAGLVGLITWSLTGLVRAAVAAALALLSFDVVTDQVGNLPMYPAMLVAGYLALWLAYLAMRATGRRALCLALVAGICLIGAVEAHAVGQLFLVAPFLLLVVETSKRGVRALAVTYLAAAGFALPRLAINLSQGGFTHLRNSRSDYWITEGHLELVNREFYGYSAGVGDYLRDLPELFLMATGWVGPLCLLLGAVASLTARRRARWFAAVAVGVLLLALLTKLPPPFPRYLLPVVPGLAVAAGVGVATLGRGARRARVAGLAAILLLVLGAVLARGRLDDRLRRNEELSVEPGLRRVARHLDDGRGVIGTRTSGLVRIDPYIPVYGTLFLDEQEFVTFLTWPSDTEVIAMARRHDIGWALVHPDPDSLRYHNTWLRPAHGLEARFPEALAASANVCKTAEEDGWILYELEPCPAGVGASSG